MCGVSSISDMDVIEAPKSDVALINDLRGNITRKNERLSVLENLYQHVPIHVKKLVNAINSKGGYVSNCMYTSSNGNGNSTGSDEMFSSDNTAVVAPVLESSEVYDLLQQAHGVSHRHAQQMHKWLIKAGHTVGWGHCDWWVKSCAQCQNVIIV